MSQPNTARKPVVLPDRQNLCHPLLGYSNHCPDIDTLEQDIIKYLSDLIPEFVLEIF